MEAAYEGVNDYTAVFLKQERVKGELLPEETIRFKFKKPFRVYMGWLKGPHEDREALYNRQLYGYKVVGHEGGFFGFITLHMDPEGKMAMRGNRHPITDVGIGRLVEIILGNVRRGAKEGVLTVKQIEKVEVFGREAYDVEVGLPGDPAMGYYAKEVRVWVDALNGLPIKVVIHGFKGELLESYGYKDLKLNPGLSDAEFEEVYKDYDF